MEPRDNEPDRDEHPPDRHEEELREARLETAQTRTARAEAAIHAIAAGADPGAAALNLSNRFTDELTSRVRGRFGRRGREEGRPEPR